MKSDKNYIAFGLRALAAAMKAKQGRCRAPDFLELTVSALRLVPGDAEARAGVLEFVEAAHTDQIAAGHKLGDFVSTWRRDIPGAPDPERHPEFDLSS